MSNNNHIIALRGFARFIDANPNLTVRELSAMYGIAKSTARKHLGSLIDLRVVVSEPVPQAVQRTLTWVMKEGFEDALDAESARRDRERLVKLDCVLPAAGRGRPKGEIDHVPTRREVRKHWAPHMVRDPLVAALFGPAQVAA